jgi:pimeloyl-ACP methyl ester carboxylesterase
LAAEAGISFLERGRGGSVPVVHFHGWPSSNVEQFASDELLAELGLHWFSLNRPGYGGTRFEPRATIRDWPARVAAWADSQNIPRFHVLGFSAGGPYATATAALLPERVASLTLVGSLCPFGKGGEDGVEVRPPWGNWGRRVLRHAEPLGVKALELLERYRKSRPIGYERRMLRHLHFADRAILDTPRMLELMAETHAEAMSQGVRHVFRDLQLHDRPWDFSPRDVACPARIFVGDEDFQVPARCSHWLHRQIPGSQLTVYRGEAHYIVFTHAAEILAPLRA